MKDQKILAILAECAAACNNCSTACLDEKDLHMMTACVKLDMDCAQICQLTASFISRGSIHAKHIMKECIEICKACAEECVQHKHLDHCRICAEVCAKCAEECAKI